MHLLLAGLLYFGIMMTSSKRVGIGQLRPPLILSSKTCPKVWETDAARNRFKHMSGASFSFWQLLFMFV
jgi:hypothetical protein